MDMAMVKTVIFSASFIFFVIYSLNPCMCQYSSIQDSLASMSGRLRDDYLDYFDDNHGFNPADYPNCQCEYIFNELGQGNCNSGIFFLLQ